MSQRPPDDVALSVVRMNAGMNLRSAFVFLAALAGMASAVGCADDLGPCNAEAALTLVYGRGDLVATKGQALAHDSCGNGAFCHSAGARESARYGVPAGLDFDTLPSPTGWRALTEQSQTAWEAVRRGAMPPGGAGAEVMGDGDWRFDAARAKGSAKLPALSTHEGKAAFRNWLACGAPVVTQAPAGSTARAAMEPHPTSSNAGNDDGDDDSSDAGSPEPISSAAPGGSATADGETGSQWSKIFEDVIEPNCAIAGCHNQAGAGNLVMKDECTAYTQLLRTGDCGAPRVEAGNLQSVILQKMESRTPACGLPMPPSAPLSAALVAAVRTWIEAGAEAPDCPPE
jgi:hypothetical protein